MTYPWSSGDVLTASDLNAYAGLVYITSASATSGTALIVNNAFSATFSSYRLVVTDLIISAASGMSMRLLSSGASNTANQYYYVRNQRDYLGVASSVQGNPNTFWEIPIIADTDSAGMTFDIHNPFVATPTTYSAHGTDSRNTGYGLLNGGGKHNVASSFDGFTIYSSRTISSFTVKVYGYNNG